MESRGSAIGKINIRRSTSDGVSNRCYILQLPDSISYEIFSRLPIKAVVRSKCVCPSWYKLISTPDFSAFYSKNSYFKPLMNFPAFGSPGLVNLLEISEDRVCVPSLINPKLSGRALDYWTFCLRGMCNGLLCYYDLRPGFYGVKVINPIMGNPISLPVIARIPCSQSTVQYFFGFNSSGNNFKVISTVHKIRGGLILDADMVDFKIFTIGVDDQWRSLSMSSMDFEAFTPMLSFGGALNWIPFKSNNVEPPELKICTFDLNNETCGQFLGPQGLSSHFTRVPYLYDTKLTIYDGRFSLLDFTMMSQTIWTMEKYADAKSWTKMVVLTTWLPTDLHCYPITKFQDGEILLVSFPREMLVSCNISDKRSSKIGTCGFPAVRRLYTPNFFLRADKMVHKGEEVEPDCKSG